MRTTLLVACLVLLAPVALADPHPHGNEGGGAPSVSVSGDDAFALGIPQAPNSPATYISVVQVCRQEPDGEMCELGKSLIERSFWCKRLMGIQGLGLLDLPWFGRRC